MKIKIVLCIFFTCLLCSCGTVKHDEDTGVTVGSNESSDVSIIDFSNNNSNWYAFKDSLDITEGIFILYGPNRH